MDDQDPNQPKSVPTNGVFTRLLSLFKRDQHSVAADLDAEGGDYGDFQEAVAKWWKAQFQLAADRSTKYRIYDEMDSFGIVSAILDVYAEEAMQRDHHSGRSVWVESTDKRLIRAGDACLTNCRAEDIGPAIIRRMCKYGDEFRRMIYQSGQGVLGWRQAAAKTVTRHEDKFARLVGFKQAGQKYRGDMKRDVSWPWDYVHFRLLGKDEEDGYGTSILDPMFRPWRQMVLSEDSALMYRLRRAPDRNMVLVDVGDMEEYEAMEYVNRFRKAMRKHEMVDPASPQYRKEYNPLTPLEDVFLPLRGNEGNTRVEQLSGSGNVDELYDLAHFRDMFFGAAKAPKAYFGFEGDINAKATLQQQDVRFARTLKRIQRAAIYGWRQTLDIHYTLLRTEGNESDVFNVTDNPDRYMVQMAPISFLDEFERLELMEQRYRIVDQMGQLAQTMGIDARVWSTYVLLQFAKLPEDMVLRLVSKMPQGDEMGFGEGFDRLSDDQKEQILDRKGEAAKGFYPLNESEKKAIDELVHASPLLRQSIANFAEYAEPDAMQQTDPANLPPVIYTEDGTAAKPLSSTDYVGDTHGQQLQEDLAALRGGNDSATPNRRSEDSAGVDELYEDGDADPEE